MVEASAAERLEAWSMAFKDGSMTALSIFCANQAPWTMLRVHGRFLEARENDNR